MTDFPRIEIDPSFVNQCVMDLARHGAVGSTGVSRTVYSPEWASATRLFAGWGEMEGLKSRSDAVGNVWLSLEGTEGGPSIVSGSHIDSQTPGGRYDGALGVIAAFNALRALRLQFGAPRKTLEAVAFCEEESSRFPSANFWGSRAVTGRIAPEDPERTIGYGGETIAQAMKDVGLDPLRIPEAQRNDIDTFIELHIEQGPILEQADLPVAVVDAITGIRHMVVRLEGTQNHAGAFPMDLRADPMAGFAEIATTVVDTAHRMGRPAVTTVGRAVVSPNYPAIIPARIEFTIDARHPDTAMRERLYAMHEQTLRTVAERRGLSVSWKNSIDHPPCKSDKSIVQVLRQAAGAQDVPHLVMSSGAAHDAQQMSRIARVAMLFVRSKDGRSHTPDEYTSNEDIVDGIKVLASALHRIAY